MADKSFEQQVKNELSGFRMKPADAVWPVVEAALQKERKRRWMVWLFLLAGCVGASFFGYYFFDQDKKEISNIPEQIQSLPKEETKEIAQEKNTTLVTTQVPPKTEPVITTPATSSTKPGRMSLKPTNISPAKNITLQTQAKQDALVDQKVKNAVAYTAPNSNQAIDDPKPAPGTSKEQTPVNTVAKDAKKEVENIPVQTQSVVVDKDPAPIVAKNDEKAAETLPSLTPVISSDAAPAAPTTINTKKNTWQWSIAVEAGLSGLRKGLDFSLAKSMSAASTAPPLTNNGQSIGTGSEPAVKDAFSFGIQLQAKKQLGKKHALGLSAGYSLLQTSTKVGRKVDSAASWNNSAGFNSSAASNFSSFYYTTTDSTGYTNQYHFLRLGADLYTPFTLFKKIRFQWQLGAGVNILLATNGLHYDPVAKKLFSNNALYAKAQSYISTGIDLSIGKTPFLYIGPHWQYSFTNLTSRPGGDQHLFLSSVKVSLVLPKKKK